MFTRRNNPFTRGQFSSNQQRPPPYHSNYQPPPFQQPFQPNHNNDNNNDNDDNRPFETITLNNHNDGVNNYVKKWKSMRTYNI